MYLSDGSLLRDQPSQLPKVLMKGSPLKRADWVKKPLSSDGSVHMEISKAMVFSETSDRIALTETSEKMGDSHLLYLSQCTPQIFSSTISLPLGPHRNAGDVYVTTCLKRVVSFWAAAPNLMFSSPTTSQGKKASPLGEVADF